MTILPPRVRPLSFCALGVTLAMAFGVPCAVAQQPAPAPPGQPVPVPPAQPAPGPVVAPPPRAPVPPAPLRPAAAAAVSRTPTPAPVQPMTRLGPPPDSVRPAAAAVAAVPTNAVAQCADGTFIVAPATPAACASRRGLVGAFPQRTPPSAPVRAAAAPAAVAAPQPSAPPAGATMQCKDGTYLFGAPAPSRCDANGGLAGVLPAPRTPPPAPSRPHRP